jgi:molybdate transport system regulatory protein
MNGGLLVEEGVKPMRLSARNQLPGTIVSIKEGAVEAQVVIDVGGLHVVSVVTADAVKDLGLAEGSKVVAIIKADSVMLAAD